MIVFVIGVTVGVMVGAPLTLALMYLWSQE